MLEPLFAIRFDELNLVSAQPEDLPGEVPDVVDQDALDDIARLESLCDRRGELLVRVEIFVGQNSRITPQLLEGILHWQHLHNSIFAHAITPELMGRA
jgi:hypothetical protein